MKYLSHITLLFVLAVLLSGCSNKAGEELLPPAQDTEEGVYINLRLGMAVTSKGNPSGGEDGDGREDGIRHENEVNTLTLYIFNDPADLGVNAPATTPIKKVIYVPTVNFVFDDNDLTNDVDYIYEQTIKVKDYTPASGDRIITVANLSWENQTEFATLGDLRDFIAAFAWNVATFPVDCKNFVMTTAYDTPQEGKLILVDGDEKLGTEERPIIAHTHIERMAARIDFWYDKAANNVGNSELVYDVRANADNAGSAVAGKLYVSHVVPINVKQSPSYLLKRVTNGIDFNAATFFTNLRYCGDETTVEGTRSGVPSNYVIDPSTKTKFDADAPSPAQLTTWFGGTQIANYLAHRPTDGVAEGNFFNGANSIARYIGAGGAYEVPYSETGYSFTHYVTLSYANENTQTENRQMARYITGLAIRAQYVPTTIYSAYNAETQELTAVTGNLRGMTYYRYVPTAQSMLEGNNLYFSSEAVAQQYSAAHPDDFATITRYDAGVCYYLAWLRHANDMRGGYHVDCPMEYGVVRNNIYRLGASLFAGPGSPTTVETEPETLKLRIFVRKWNLRLHPEIIF